MPISKVQQIRQYDLLPRERKKCGGCDKRRLCTKVLLGIDNSTERWFEWFCNECLSEVPPWRY